MSHSICWDNNPLSFFPTITIPSPPLSTTTSPFADPSMLPLTSASLADQQLCISTRQVFDYPDIASPLSPTPPSPEYHPSQLSIAIDTTTAHQSTQKRPSPSVDQSVPKRPRPAGERISTKDFVPPDVSGLSKREARLVKNRAAAFLSRQRKREEFENMEIRVAELEQENARLLAITQNRSTSPADEEALAENEQLRAQLAAAQERERELCDQLRKASLSSSRDVSASVKPEPIDTNLSLSAPASQTTSAPRSAQSLPHKASASFGLMVCPPNPCLPSKQSYSGYQTQSVPPSPAKQVLLCALPSLLSMHGQSTCPTSFSLPSPSTSFSAFDLNSLISNNNECTSPSSLIGLDDHDFSRSAIMSSQTNAKRNLEFVDGALTGLDALDISFETSHTDDGRIRVRIHPSSASVSTPPSSGSLGTVIAPSPTYPGSSALSAFDALASPIHGPVSPTSAMSHSILSRVDGDPFLSANSMGTFDAPAPGSLAMSWFDDAPYSTFDLNALKPSSWASPFASPLSSSPASSLSSYSSSPSSLDESRTGWKKRHVRIALKSMPAAGGEGGEWEVQVC